MNEKHSFRRTSDTVALICVAYALIFFLFGIYDPSAQPSTDNTLEVYNARHSGRKASSEIRKKVSDLDDDKSLKNESLLSASTSAKSYSTATTSPEVVRSESMLRYRKKRQDIYSTLPSGKAK